MRHVRVPVQKSADGNRSEGLSVNTVWSSQLPYRLELNSPVNNYFSLSLSRYNLFAGQLRLKPFSHSLGVLGRLACTHTHAHTHSIVTLESIPARLCNMAKAGRQGTLKGLKVRVSFAEEARTFEGWREVRRRKVCYRAAYAALTVRITCRPLIRKQPVL